LIIIRDYDVLNDIHEKVWVHDFARAEVAGLLLRATEPFDEPNGTRELFRVEAGELVDKSMMHKIKHLDEHPIWKIVYHIQEDRPFGERTYKLIDFEGDLDQFHRDLVIARTFL
jgi:hypothetical protein